MTRWPVPDIAKLFFDLPHGLEISCAVECIPPHEQEFDEVPRDIPASDVQTVREMW